MGSYKLPEKKMKKAWEEIPQRGQEYRKKDPSVKKTPPEG